MKSKNRNFNIPNALTAVRFVLIFPFVFYFISNEYLKAGIVLLVSGLTDLLDGWIARQFNQSTELGQMLDPLADKLTQASVAICLAVEEPVLIPLLAIFVVKEALMVTAAIFLIGKNKKKPSGSKWYGKAATVLFYISFGIIVAMRVFGWFTGEERLHIAVALLSVTAGFMIYAFVRYAKIYFRILRSDDPRYRLDIQEVMDKKKK
ncbi:MAG TPA: CDP-alcohol phosphatidyltransferase family protein [Ruminococcaceae bacterium]|mgnify:CR=1 FL=1|jgi:cardiolipin synthase|nr:CDP-alcohol phosphatidyltransferase family protein [Oscillospiraceae bacterium]HBG55500.1 CDP-alcohol phosphatidyltransferase family protein [Oscillospiraceae bacterium]HBT91157.1 CDP-alcohol phosphatidyltransferase family protein [Oscillospiraceae bacterium]HCB90447.1 CDP-alcohol phosphatidyltransferase family protein [Oscillospiraceae bacterium]